MNIYQVFTRIYGNPVSANKEGGSYSENGSAKMNDFTQSALKRIRDFGFSHIWYTGIIEHATQTDYSQHGIRKDHPWVVKGKAGSPYAIKDYYDVDPDLAVDVTHRMKEFEHLVERTHQAGLKVIIDFVPNHVARQYHSDVAPKGVEDLGASDDVQMHFSPSNNFYYCQGVSLCLDHINKEAEVPLPYSEHPAKATGNDHFSACPSQNDWYETIKLNYGVDYSAGRSPHFSPIPDTWLKMTHILSFWAAKGVDAFRCDMAEMVPVEFWHYAITKIKAEYPHIEFIAEVYNPALYRNYIHHGKFDYLYDKVGLYDTLRAVINHQAPASAITHCWQQVDDIKRHMLYFLENHDEQRIASPFFCGDPRKAFPALVVECFMGTNPVMIYAGQELGEQGMDKEGFSGHDGRTTIFDYWSPQSLRKLASLPPLGKTGTPKAKAILTDQEWEIYEFYRHILRLRTMHPALEKGLFYDLMYTNHAGERGLNPDRHFAFLRRSPDELILCVANFGETEARIGVHIPKHAFEFLSLPEGVFDGKDIISDTPASITLCQDGYSEICIPPHHASAIAIALP